ncbi:MAG: caspase family protein [Myxococcota bacterium]
MTARLGRRRAAPARRLDRARGRAFLVASLLVASALAGLAGAADAEGGRRRALLVGINDYQAVPDLNGALNDVAAVREVLVSRFAFAPEDVRVVTDAAATRAGILAELDALAERAQPGDVVYVHYSGHGSQVTDLGGDEADGLDETLVPQDGRTPGVPDITDDELGERFARLADTRLVVTLDSCHSGTATRGASALRTRFVAPDERRELYAATATRGVVATDGGDHLLLAGAASHQEALDGPIDGSSYGLFSYALARSLATAPPDATARGLFDHVQRELERIKAQLGLDDLPEPQLEGRPEQIDTALLPPAAAESDRPRLAWVSALPEEGGAVRLVRGSGLGARPGSVWAVYPEGERAFAPGGAQLEVVVERLDRAGAPGAAADAIARPTSDEATPLLAPGRAVAIAPAPAVAAVAVRWDDADAERRARMTAAALDALPELELVGDASFARFAVGATADAIEVRGADGRALVARHALPASRDDERSVARALAALFARSLTAAELLSISNDAAALGLRVGIAGRPPTESAPGERPQTEVVRTSSAAPELRIRREGEPRSADNSLWLEVEASEACSLVVVDVDTEGRVALLFPNAISEASGFVPGGRIEPASAVRIPDSLGADNTAGFFLDYVPPTGTDTVRAFCFRDARAAGALRDAIGALEAELRTRGAARGGERSAVRRVLLGELAPALARAAARGIAVVAAEPDAPAPPPEPAPTPEPEPAAEGAAVAPEAAPEPAAPKPSPDWAAASLTLSIVD